LDPAHTIDHEDWDKTNNRVWNLRVLVLEENARDGGYRTGKNTYRRHVFEGVGVALAGKG